MNQEERRIVLLGRTGVGKSATGNTILGRNHVFRTKKSLNSVTEHCELVGTRVGGKRLRVVDMPGFLDTGSVTRDHLAVELSWSVYLSQPGVHAFILVVEFGRFTEQEEEIIKRLQKVFGEQVTNHMFILFTCGDGVGEEIIDEEKRTNEHLRRVLDQCGGRFHIFNNAEPQNRQKVTELLQNIDRMVQQNEETFTRAEPNNRQQAANPPQNRDTRVQHNGGFYTNGVFGEAQSLTWKEFWEKHKLLFFIGAGVLAVAVAVGYVVLTKDVTPAQGLMSLWMKEEIKVESEESFTAGLMHAAVVGVAAACKIIRSRML